MSKAAVVALALLAAVASLAGVTNARADELAQRGCITSEPGSEACAAVAKSRLHQVFGHVALSPDGRSLYAVGGDGITRFDRDPTTGALTYRGCITGDESFGPTTAGCVEIPTATAQGFSSGLGTPVGVTVSPDGKSVYVAAGGDSAVARFSRNPATGALAYRGCITGSKFLGPSGSDVCKQIPSATDDGLASGLASLTGLAVSPDGNSLYAISDVVVDGQGDAAVARFDRAPSGGLSYRDCISGNSDLGPSGSGACKLIPSARPWATNSGLSPVSIAISADGKSLYTASQHVYLADGSSGLDRFDRNPTTGALTYRGCITGDKRSGSSGSGACEQIPGATKHGLDSGMDTFDVTVSPDGRTLYVGGFGQVAWLGRNPSTGALAYRGCITSHNGEPTPAPGVCRTIPRRKKSDLGGDSLAVSPDGKTLYAGHGYTLARLDPDPATGALTFRDCVTSSTVQASGSGVCAPVPAASRYGQGAGLGVESIAPSEDGLSLYVAGTASSTGTALTRFGFAPQTRITRATVRRHLASFSFDANRPSTFECKLKGKRVKPTLRHWRHCGPSALRYDGKVRYLHLHSGRRTLRVRATDAIGNTDPTPAKRRWRVR